jgi:OOP family OmpA-OmpF porin
MTRLPPLFNNQEQKMKLQFSVALIAAAMAFPMAAQAQTEAPDQGYIGASVGSAKQKYDIDGFGSASENKTAYKVYGGYRFDRGAGLEVGYIDFGKASVSDGDVTLSGKPKSFYLAATYNYKVATQVALSAKIGVAFNKTKATISAADESVSEDFNKTTAMFGIGASFDFTKNVSGVLEYEYFGKTADEDGISLKPSAVTVGVRYTF